MDFLIYNVSDLEENIEVKCNDLLSDIISRGAEVFNTIYGFSIACITLMSATSFSAKVLDTVIIMKL